MLFNNNTQRVLSFCSIITKKKATKSGEKEDRQRRQGAEGKEPEKIPLKDQQDLSRKAVLAVRAACRRQARRQEENCPVYDMRDLLQ